MCKGKVIIEFYSFILLTSYTKDQNNVQFNVLYFVIFYFRERSWQEKAVSRFYASCLLHLFGIFLQFICFLSLRDRQEYARPVIFFHQENYYIVMESSTRSEKMLRNTTKKTSHIMQNYIEINKSRCISDCFMLVQSSDNAKLHRWTQQIFARDPKD